MKKVCSKCGESRNISDYPKCKKSKIGLKSYCKICANEMLKDWAKRNKDKIKKYNLKHQPAQLKKRKEKLMQEQKANKCQVCGCSLTGRILSTKYCSECKKEKIKEWKIEDYKKNINRIKEYYQQNKQAINKKNRLREQNRRDNLTDRYIKKLLREKSGFITKQINENPEIIEIKRILIKTNRL